MAEKNYLTAVDVSEYMGISIPMAYKIIRKLNDELKEQGYITISLFFQFVIEFAYNSMTN